VISDAVLLMVAKLKPENPAALKKLRGISSLMLRRLGDDILAAVVRGLSQPETALLAPPRGERRRFDPGASKRLDALKEWRRKKAVELKLDPGVLSPLTYLQAVARTNPPTVEEMLAIPDLSRWRAREFGREWIEVMSKK
jgi:ribonuclease D